MEIIFGDLVPVDDVPPSLNILKPAILVFQIVGVFPNIEAKECFAAVHDGIVLISGRLDHELAVAEQQPSPT